MVEIKHILFPFDFSQQALLTVPVASAFAKCFDARITLMSVIPPMWDESLVGTPSSIATDTRRIELELKSRLEGVLRKEFAVERVTDCGDPALIITGFVRSSAVDLIMMPTYGSGIFRNLLVGSVTAKVLHDAICSVWTAAHAEEQPVRDVPKTILCAVDDTPTTPALVQWAAEFGLKTPATVKLLHVVPPISAWLTLPTARDIQKRTKEEARIKIDLLQRSVGADLPVRVAEGEILHTVAVEAMQEGADLIIIGRGSLQSPLGRLRTHAYGIIQKSPCPVLSI